MKEKALGPLQGSSCCSGGPLIQETEVQADVSTPGAYPGAPLLRCPALYPHADIPYWSYRSEASSSL